MPCGHVENQNESGIDNDDNDNDDDDARFPTCSICIERFKVGDEVSFSPLADGCHHFFHHKCVREWLLRRRGCPCCR
eukprot:jgi/Psemu1/225999/e_gw1.1703.2.1